jgi:ABC-type bacteriocin/lantibiotic exporter with double-glycine peptidase domain
MLRANGLPIEPTALRTGLAPRNAHGLSLLEIAKALQSRSLDVEVRKIAVRDLRWLPQPSILHIRSDEGEGHYLVALSATDSGLAAVDATTGRERVYPADLLERDWTGYVIVMRTNRDSQKLVAVASLTCGGALVGAFVTFGLWRSRTDGSCCVPSQALLSTRTL